MKVWRVLRMALATSVATASVAASAAADPDRRAVGNAAASPLAAFYREHDKHEGWWDRFYGDDNNNEFNGGDRVEDRGDRRQSKRQRHWFRRGDFDDGEFDDTPRHGDRDEEAPRSHRGYGQRGRYDEGGERYDGWDQDKRGDGDGWGHGDLGNRHGKRIERGKKDGRSQDRHTHDRVRGARGEEDGDRDKDHGRYPDGDGDGRHHGGDHEGSQSDGTGHHHGKPAENNEGKGRHNKDHDDDQRGGQDDREDPRSRHQQRGHDAGNNHDEYPLRHTHDHPDTRGGDDDHDVNHPYRPGENIGRVGGNRDHGGKGGGREEARHDDDEDNRKWNQRERREEPNEHGDRDRAEFLPHPRGDDTSPTQHKPTPPSEHQGGSKDEGAAPSHQVSQTLREETEHFLSGVLNWLNELVGPEAAATLVVDTTFSLKKSDGQSLESPCGGEPVSKLFPVMQKFVDNPQSVDLLDSDVEGIRWTPASACTKASSSAEIEGGVFASFRLTCEGSLLLNVSIASGGSTPTVEGQQIEGGGLYIDVDVLAGQISTSQAQGSIIGTLRNRHYPENTDDVLTNWAQIVKACAANQSLMLDGLVGGGWTIYTPDTSAPDTYTASAVGYSESFRLSRPPTNDPASAPTELIQREPAPPTQKPLPGLSAGSELGRPPTVVRANAAAPLADIASDAASAYMQEGILCGQQSPVRSSCAGVAVMSQLMSFHANTPSVASSVTQFQTHTASSPLAATLVGIAVVMVASVGAAIVTLRRRNGYVYIPSRA